MPAIRQLPNIEINQNQCISPMKCGDCLRVCPGGVVLISVPRYNEKFRQCDGEDFTVMVHNRPSCIGCMKCVDVCPAHCIRVYYEIAAETA